MGEVELYFHSKDRIDERTRETLDTSESMIAVDLKSEGDDDDYKHELEGERITSQSDIALYDELDDKNKAIEMLKKRLMNQQIQLNYYMNRTLTSESVMKFSEHCMPHLVEESINSCLAMCKFLTDSGEKSQLSCLHDELRECEGRVCEMIEKQEDLLQKVTEETFKETTDDLENELRFADRALQMAHLDLYSRLMSTTLKVSKELEIMRTHVERISALEEHRNTLISHVFSLPSEQRLAGLRLAELECKLCSVGDKNPMRYHKDPGEGDYSNSNLRELLQKIESDALILLSKTEEQRNKFARELEAAKKENQKLTKQLKQAEEINPDYKVDQLQSKCSTIEREIEEMKTGMDVEMAEKDKQIERLELELSKAVAKHFEQKRQAIERRDRERKMKHIINMQEDQIRNLLRILSSMEKESRSSGLRSVLSNHEMEVTADVNNKEQNNQHATHEQETEVDPEPEPEPDQEREENEEEQEEEQEEDDEEYEVVEEEEEECIDRGEEKPSSNEKENLTADAENNYSTTDEVIREQNFADEEEATEEEIENICTRMSKRDECLASTSLKVEAYNKHGVKESMRATLESTTEVDGILIMNSSSRVRLRLQCTSPRRRQNMYDRCCQTQESEKTVFESEVPDMAPGTTATETTKTTDRSHWFSMSHQSMQLMERLSSIGNGLENILNNRSGRRALLENIREIYSQFYGPANS